LTNLPQQQSQRQTTSPTIPQAKTDPTSDEPKPSLLSRMGGWFAASDDGPQPEDIGPPVSVESESATPGKPYFPRLRAMFAAPETEVATDEPAITRQPSPIEPELEGEPSIPETAEKPWYQRMFR
jgi:hypothetical protein